METRGGPLACCVALSFLMNPSNSGFVCAENNMLWGREHEGFGKIDDKWKESKKGKAVILL